MFDKVLTIAIGVILMLMGLQTFFMGGFWMWGRYLNYGSSHRVIAAVFIIVGLLFVYRGTKLIIKNKRKRPPPRNGNRSRE